MRAHFFRLVPFDAPGVPLRTTTPMLDIEITGTAAFDTSIVNVVYHINGATEHVKFNSTNAHPSRKNELWRTTCFELFLKVPTRAEYWEVNLAPSRDWNVYRFTDYRSTLQPELLITDISITTEVAQSRLASLSATLPLPLPVVGQQLIIGISSVIEDTAGNLYYFALQHSGVKPDFHDPAGFVLSFDPASA